jgi:MFS family permease
VFDGREARHSQGRAPEHALSAVYSAIVAILLSVLVLITGNSLLNTMVPLSAKIAGFSSLTIGLLGSCLFAGMLAGTIFCPMIIRRVGHVKAYSIFAALAIIGAVSYPLLLQPWWWLALRGLMGFAFAGLFNVIDGWVQGKADNATRGRIGATNQMVHFIAVAVGQQLLPLDEPDSFRLYTLAAIFFALSIIPFSLSRTPPPEMPSTVSLQVGWLARNAPASMIAAFAVGTANGSFWSLAPVYASEIGLDTRGISVFLTAVVIGSAIAIWPIGRASDRTDRRRVIAILAAVATLAEAALAVSGRPHIALLAGLGFVVGGFAMNVYPVALSHANDRAEGGRRVAVASTLLFLYCIGAIVGPTVAAALMSTVRPSALFGFMALTHATLLAATVWRIVRRPPPPRVASEPQPHL